MLKLYKVKAFHFRNRSFINLLYICIWRTKVCV